MPASDPLREAVKRLLDARYAMHDLRARGGEGLYPEWPEQVEREYEAAWTTLHDAAAHPPVVPEPLDVAWAEVEAALPLAGWVDPLDGRWVIPHGTWSIDIRHEDSGDGYFEPAVEGFWATGKVDGPDRPFAVRGDLGPSPADALRSLAASMLAARALAAQDQQPAPESEP